MKFDLNKIEDAIAYMTCLAQGNDPITGMPAKDLDLDDPIMIRCFHFVLDVLREVRTNDGQVGKDRNTRQKGSAKKEFPYEVLQQFRYKNDKSIMFVLRQFAEPVENENVRKPNPALVNKWLEKNGYIEKKTIPENGRECWFPTQKGLDMGLYLSNRGDPSYGFVTIIYSEKAQQFLAENLERMMQETSGRILTEQEAAS